MPAAVRLGDSANLLLGLKPTWFGVAGVSPFDPPEQTALRDFVLPEPESRGTWGEPEVSLHDDVESLVDALFAYPVRAILSDRGRSALPVHALMLGGGRRAAGLAMLEGLLGISSDQLECGGLVLLRVRRQDAEHRHEAEQGGIGRRLRIANYWTREGLHSIARLQFTRRIHGHRLSAGIDRHQAGRYLDFMYDYGTHFVSRVVLGDQLFQVLACRQDRYSLLQALWRQGSGSGKCMAVAFADYTGSTWIENHGQVCSAAQDPELTRLLAAGVWRDAEREGANSLLVPFARQRAKITALLEGMRRSIPFLVEFSAHSPYMGDYRANAWQRVLKGALLQRYGDLVRVSFGDWDDSVGVPASYASTGRSVATILDQHGICKVMADAVFVNEALMARLGKPETLCLFVRHLDIDHAVPVTLPGNRVTLCALVLDAADGHDRVPTLRVEDTAFETFRCFVANQRGAIYVQDKSDRRRDVLFQGLHFGADALDRVVLRTDTARPDASTLIALRGAMLGALDDVEAWWCDALCRVELPDTDICTVRASLEWLAASVLDSGVMEVDPAHRAYWDTLRRRAELLARFGPMVVADDPEMPTSLALEFAELALRHRLLLSAPRREGVDEPGALAERFQIGATSLRDMLSSAQATDSDINMTLGVRLTELDAARQRARQELESLGNALPKLVAGNESDWERARHLLAALTCVWGGAGSVSGMVCMMGDQLLSDALSALFRAEQARIAAELLYALLRNPVGERVNELIGELDGPVVWPSYSEWEALPGTFLAVLALVAGNDALMALRDALKTLANAGAALSVWVPQVCAKVQTRHRDLRETIGDAVASAEPDASGMRLHLCSRQLYLLSAEARISAVLASRKRGEVQAAAASISSRQQPAV